VRMPPRRPVIQQTFVPYTFSREDIRKLLRATRQPPCKWPSSLAPQTMRTLVLLLYATGALVGEILGLTSDDVDSKAGFITIRSRRSYRTRRIPVGADLRNILETYVKWKRRRKLIGTHFLLYSDGRPLRLQTAGRHFRKLCLRANILRYDETTYQPRMQDLRCTFAVHRITAWIKNGADMNRMLPALSAYMGQVGLASTQRYLLLTPERFRKELSKLSPQRQKKHWRDNPRLMKFLAQL
jgi:integrase/recombinase XerD